MSWDGDNQDGGGVSVRAWADLTATLGSLRDEMAARRARDARLAETPVDWPIQAFGVGVTNVPLALDLGGPQQGRVRLVRRLTVGGLLPTDTPAGTAYAFVVAVNPVDPSTLALRAGSLGSLVDIASGSLPQVSFYSNRQVVVRHQERLWIVITSATNNQPYQAQGLVVDYQEAAFKERFDV